MNSSTLEVLEPKFILIFRNLLGTLLRIRRLLNVVVIVGFLNYYTFNSGIIVVVVASLFRARQLTQRLRVVDDSGRHPSLLQLLRRFSSLLRRLAVLRLGLAGHLRLPLLVAGVAIRARRVAGRAVEDTFAGDALPDRMVVKLLLDGDGLVGLRRGGRGRAVVQKVYIFILVSHAHVGDRLVALDVELHLVDLRLQLLPGLRKRLVVLGVGRRRVDRVGELRLVGDVNDVAVAGRVEAHLLRRPQVRRF